MAHTASTSGTPDASGPDAGNGREAGQGKGRTHRAGAFDMRNFIAALIGIYGVVLTIYGLVDRSASQVQKSAGLDINLWAGLGMVVVAACFAVWARLRPVVVPDDVPTEDEPSSAH